MIAKPFLAACCLLILGLSLHSQEKTSFSKAIYFHREANKERKNRSALLFKYDSLSVLYARKSNNDSMLVVYLLRIAQDHCTENEPDKAKKYVDEASAIAKRSRNDRLLIASGYGMGFYLFKKFSFSEARTVYEKALDISILIKDDYWIAILKRSVYTASIFSLKPHNNQKYIFDALEYFRKTDKYEEGVCNSVIGHTYRLQGNMDKAIDYFSIAAELFKETNDKIAAADMYIFIAEGYFMKKGNLPEALAYTIRGENLYYDLKYQRGLMKAYISYGRIFGASSSSIQASDQYFGKADSLNKVIGDTKTPLIIAAYRLERSVQNGPIGGMGDLLRRADSMLRKQIPAVEIRNFIERSYRLGFLGKEEMDDLNNYTRTGKIDSVLWQDKNELKNFTPYSGTFRGYDTNYVKLFLTNMLKWEEMYRSRIKDDSIAAILLQNKAKSDSLSKAILENRIAHLKVSKKNWTIASIALITIVTGILLYKVYREKEKLDKAKKSIEVLKKEAHHRVTNILNNIAYITRCTKRNSTDTESFELLEEKVKPLMILYEMLGNGNQGNIRLQDYFEKICNNLLISYSANKEINFIIDADLVLGGKKAELIGLIVNELITNSFKHAFLQQDSGTIEVICRKDEKGVYMLTVADSGPGFIEVNGKKTGDGLTQVRALAYQLKAIMVEKIEKELRYEFYFT